MLCYKQSTSADNPQHLTNDEEIEAIPAYATKTHFELPRDHQSS